MHDSREVEDERHAAHLIQPLHFVFAAGEIAIDHSRVILEARAVEYAYSGDTEGGPPRPALVGINLSVAQGEYLAIIGPSGSGKTTLLKHFNALLKPTAGEVLVDGLSTGEERNTAEIRLRCGMIFQDPDNQLVASTVEEDVAFGLENQALPPEEIRRRVDQAIGLLGLGHLAKRPPHLLSGGEKQRVAVAGVLVMRPRCILMDEPTSMLDPAGQGEVIEAVRRLNRELGVTVVHVTHSPAEAALADRILVLDAGKIAAAGTPVEIFNDRLTLRRLGLRGTVSSELAAFLRDRGYSLPGWIIHDWEMVEQLCSSARKT